MGLLACGCVLALLSSGCATVMTGMPGYRAAALDIRKVHETIIGSGPAGGQHSRLYPRIRYIDEEKIIASGRGFRVVSMDGGFSWEPYDGIQYPELRYSYTIDAGEERFHYHPGFTQRRGDQILGSSAAWSRAGVITETIERPVVVMENPPSTAGPGGFLYAYQGMFDPDGNILILAQTTLDEERGVRTARNALGGFHRRAVVLRSEDRGQTFSHFSTVATSADAPWAAEGPSESTWVVLPDGDILCVMRTGSDRSHQHRAEPMLSARSSDWGKTWHSHSRIPRRGVRPRMIRLENGILVCTAGRPDNNLIFSLDDGRTWTREYNLDSRHQSSGYLYVAEIEPNRVIVVYELHDYSAQRFWLWEPPDRKNVAKAVVLDVSRRLGSASDE
jgi:hypothetical protein